MALLRWAIPGGVGALACVLWSDCHSELVEDRAEPVAGGNALVSAPIDTLSGSHLSGDSPSAPS
jgi:hypothetical protein